MMTMTMTRMSEDVVDEDGGLLIMVYVDRGWTCKSSAESLVVVCHCRSQRPKRSKAASVSPAQAGSLTRDVSMLRELWQSGWHAAWRTVPMLLCSACIHMGRCQTPFVGGESFR